MHFLRTPNRANIKVKTWKHIKPKACFCYGRSGTLRPYLLGFPLIYVLERKVYLRVPSWVWKLNGQWSIEDKHAHLFKFFLTWGFPGGSDGKESACLAGDPGSILGCGRSPGGGHGNPLQYSCLENWAWWAAVQGVTESWTQLTLSLTWHWEPSQGNEA